MSARSDTWTLSSLVQLALPGVAVVALVLAWGRDLPVVAEIVVIVLLAGAVLSAVHHAEVVAARVGEPFGSLTLAVAVTVIEVGLIVTLMVSGGPGTESLARDTVFAAVMITCNGIIGLSLVVGALRTGMAVFNAEGSGSALAAVLTLATLCMVVPAFTTSSPGPEFSPAQLAFAAVVSLLLYALFVFVQTVRQRDYFLPVTPEGRPFDPDEHAEPPSNRTAWASLGLLLAALVGVVGLAKVESPTIDATVRAAGLPLSFVGVVIAVLVLAPETLAAVRNARRERVQISLNLALGSAMASIGLTIPTIAVASIWLDGRLVLGLGSVQIVLLALTAAVGILTLFSGRAALLRGGVHLVLCAAFLFLSAVP